MIPTTRVFCLPGTLCTGGGLPLLGMFVHACMGTKYPTGENVQGTSILVWGEKLEGDRKSSYIGVTGNNVAVAATKF